MILSDALSRRPDHVPENNENDKLQTLLPEELFVNLIDVELQKEITEALINDKLAQHIVKILETGPSQASKDLNDWQIEDFEGQKAVFYQEKQYVPGNTELRRNIVKKYHDHQTAGHPGEIETLNQIKVTTGGQE